MDFLRKLETQNNGNWRNAFITLSSLGLIDSNNLPTKSGMSIVSQSFEDFVADILFSYIEPYVREIFIVIKKYNGTAFFLNNKGFSSAIRDKYKSEVLFLTESNNRYMSSWLNLLRDDYGCIYFRTRSSVRREIYNPIELNRNALKTKISEHSCAYPYIQKYFRLLGGN